jgi:Protein of unknown function (DUF3237)
MRSRMIKVFAATLFATTVALAVATLAASPTTSVQSEYLMTLYVPIAEGYDVDDTLRVVNHPDGWVEGPQIKGKIIPPSSDMLRNMGNGINRLDVRLTIRTDDDQIIFVSYNGVANFPKEARARFLRGELLQATDCYFVTAPTFETKSQRYGWLNGMQAVGKMRELKRGEGAHITYDIFVIK